MFFETLKGEVYEFHRPKYVEENNKEYIDGGNKIVKDIFTTSSNGSTEVYYVEINSNGEKVFISKEVYNKLEKELQESIEDILIENHHLYDNEEYKLYTIAQRKMDDFPAPYEDIEDYYYYKCDESANYIYSCDIIKFTYDWLEDNNVKKLKKEIEELKEQVETIENAREFYFNLYKEAKEYEENVENYFIHSNNIKTLEVENVVYIELKNKIKKYTESINSSNYGKYQYSYFKIENEILTPEYIKNMIRKKEIPMYCGLPFRKLQDLYKIMIFLESEKYIDYKQENEIIDFTNKIEFKNKIIYYGNIEIDDENIRYNTSKDIKSIFNPEKEINVDLYKTRIIACFNNKEFKNLKELKKLIKERCYKDKDLLSQSLLAFD